MGPGPVPPHLPRYRRRPPRGQRRRCRLPPRLFQPARQTKGAARRRRRSRSLRPSPAALPAGRSCPPVRQGLPRAPGRTLPPLHCHSLGRGWRPARPRPHQSRPYRSRQYRSRQYRSRQYRSRPRCPLSRQPRSRRWCRHWPRSPAGRADVRGARSPRRRRTGRSEAPPPGPPAPRPFRPGPPRPGHQTSRSRLRASAGPSSPAASRLAARRPRPERQPAPVVLRRLAGLPNEVAVYLLLSSLS